MGYSHRRADAHPLQRVDVKRKRKNDTQKFGLSPESLTDVSSLHTLIRACSHYRAACIFWQIFRITALLCEKFAQNLHISDRVNTLKKYGDKGDKNVAIS